MTIRYRGGQPMPKNVQEALRYVGKVGMITRGTWYRYFGRGKMRWQQDQLLSLIKNNVLKKHSCARLEETWVLTESSIELLKKLGWPCVLPIPPQFIDHDEVVANSILTLERNQICQMWLTERELKTLKHRKYIVDDKDNEVKYPDAVFDLIFKGDPMTFALEYERTGKSFSRYRSILNQYRKLDSVSLVLYVVESDTIKKTIQSVMKFIGDAVLVKKIAFIDAHEWKINPLKAQIQLRSKVITFDEIAASKTA